MGPFVALWKLSKLYVLQYYSTKWSKGPLLGFRKIKYLGQKNTGKCLVFLNKKKNFIA